MFQRLRICNERFTGLPVRRAGLTLIELLLVLVIMVLAAAWVFPRMFDAQGRHTLRTAGDQLEASLVDARHQAMAQGQSMLLVYHFGTPYYAVVPEPDDEPSRQNFNQVIQSLTQMAAMLRPDREPVALPDGLPGMARLPSGTLFLSGEFGTTQASEPGRIQAEIAGLPFVLFAPDGTTDDALFFLANDSMAQIYVQLRGLTGTVTVADATTGPGIATGSQP